MSLTPLPHLPFLQAPAVVPPLDPDFRPAVLANRNYAGAANQTGFQLAAGLALEQGDGSLEVTSFPLLPPSHPEAAANFFFLERLLKFYLWSRGGYRVFLKAPRKLTEALRAHYQESATGQFDADIMGRKIYERKFEILAVDRLPPARQVQRALGRHLDGNRIGFDLGGSDRKVAAVINGRPVYSEEFAWQPMTQSDPQWHFDQVMEVLQAAAGHLPRVDAIGGSAAGVYVNNRVKVASLFRGVPEDLFESRVKKLFQEIKKVWGDIPFEVANDGEVTALAGSMAMGKNSVLGLAMGTSQAAGYVTPQGTITSWLNELAFAPIDFSPTAPADDWSGDVGCGAQYLSQQAVGRLLPKADLQAPEDWLLPRKLEWLQELMQQNDPRARLVYETIGIYLGYAVAHYSDYYPFEQLLVLGRVTTGAGGEIILQQARVVLETEFPELASRISFHVPDEKEKRHGQAVAAASLPEIKR